MNYADLVKFENKKVKIQIGYRLKPGQYKLEYSGGGYWKLRNKDGDCEFHWEGNIQWVKPWVPFEPKTISVEEYER